MDNSLLIALKQFKKYRQDNFTHSTLMESISLKLMNTSIKALLF